MDRIETGYMVFLAEGQEGVGAVRSIAADHLVVYVENAGDFRLFRATVKKVHDRKVILDWAQLDKAFLQAIGHVHDREDPSVAG